MTRIRGVVFSAAVLLLSLWGAGTAGAQGIVQFNAPQVGNRRVVLNWDRVPGDTLTAQDRQDCRDRCGDCCQGRYFGGYQIWRSSEADTGRMILLRTYSILDTTWTFRGGERVFVDPDSFLVRACKEPFPDPDCNPSPDPAVAPFNGFPYYYAITWFESQVDTIAGAARISEFPMQTQAEGRLSEPVKPSASAVSVPPLLGAVNVVPNPFNLRDPFRRSSFGAENRIQFINLPSPATIRIYTTAGDLIRTLENNDIDASVDWDLRNDNGEDVVGGVYMFHVETAGGSQTRLGHFVVIR